MKYCFQLLPHANSHYRHAQELLGAHEMICLLSSLGVEAPVETREIGGSMFFVFECPELAQPQLKRLLQHSSLLLVATEEGGLLRPLTASREDYFPRDLSEMLKYKGKTSATFTRMLINLSLAAAGISSPGGKTTVLDPLCGRGTTCFCALEMGLNSVGIDVDKNDLNEIMNFYSRYMTYGHFKHRVKQSSETCGKKSVPAAELICAPDKAAYLKEDTRSLRLYLADTGLTAPLMRKRPADVLVADLPYGVQHGPQEESRKGSLEGMLNRVLPLWREGVRKGGAMALSFNTLTLKKEKLAALAENAGWRVLKEEAWYENSHFVEQAVTRDLIVAVNDGQILGRNQP